VPATPDSAARPGIWSKFPKVKNYLAKFELGPIGALADRAWERDELPRLRRWAAGESFTYTLGPRGAVSTSDYNLSSAGVDLQRVGAVEEYFAIHAALRGDADWHERWCKAVAYLYWAECFDHCWHRHAQSEFDRGIRRQQLQMINLVHGLGACVGNCVALGWFDFGIDLARRIFDAIDHGWCYDGGDGFGRRRTQHFVLRLVADWQGWPAREQPRCAHDEPVFEALLQHWRDADAAALVEPVQHACDRHTQQCRYDNAKGEYFDLYVQTWYVPFEILALWRLRESLQLPNPTVDHPLLQTPLGRLHERRPPWTDPLLDGVVARARREFSDL
jgi:hypothetical protein